MWHRHGTETELEYDINIRYKNKKLNDFVFPRATEIPIISISDREIESINEIKRETIDVFKDSIIFIINGGASIHRSRKEGRKK